MSDGGSDSCGRNVLHRRRRTCGSWRWSGVGRLAQFLGTLLHSLVRHDFGLFPLADEGGFFVLGAYMRRFCPATITASMRVAALALVVVGYLITALVFQSRADLEFVTDLELSWGQTTINVAMMGVGLFVLAKSVRIKNVKVRAVIGEFSDKSFGIYLIHMMVLNLLSGVLNPLIESYPLKIVVITLAVFFCSYLAVRLLSLLPKSKYLLG